MATKKYTAEELKERLKDSRKRHDQANPGRYALRPSKLGTDTIVDGVFYRECDDCKARKELEVEFPKHGKSGRKKTCKVCVDTKSNENRMAARQKYNKTHRQKKKEVAKDRPTGLTPRINPVPKPIPEAPKKVTTPVGFNIKHQDFLDKMRADGWRHVLTSGDEYCIHVFAKGMILQYVQRVKQKKRCSVMFDDSGESFLHEASALKHAEKVFGQVV